MPAKSKQQFKFMAAIASGSLKKPGLSPDKAKEYLSADYKSLPKHLGLHDKRSKSTKK